MLKCRGSECGIVRVADQYRMNRRCDEAYATRPSSPLEITRVFIARESSRADANRGIGMEENLRRIADARFDEILLISDVISERFSEL